MSVRTVAAAIVAMTSFVGSALSGEQYAFLVGVKDYDGTQLKPLNYARDDILAFRDALLEAGFKKGNVVVLHDDLKTLPSPRYLANGDRIRAELKVLLSSLDAEDSIIVALAGHGVQFKGETDNYFCPLNASLTDRQTLFSLTELYGSLQACPCRQKLLLCDACRNDPESNVARAAGGPALETVTQPQVTPPPAGIVALFSCAEGQQAFEWPEIKHGIFFYHVLEGFCGQADTGDHELTLDELIAFTKAETKTYARLKLSTVQTPRQQGFFDGEWVLRRVGPAKAITNSLGMTLQRVPAGEFLMGSTASEVAATLRFDPLFTSEMAKNEQPQHRVQISTPFYLGTYEVTKGEFAAFVDDGHYVTEAERDGRGGDGSNADGTWAQRPQYTWRNAGFPQTDDHPVVNVSGNDATAFCEWLSRKEGVAYRLPTEAEWEYACRAGSKTMFQSGNDPEGLALLGNVADDGARIAWTGYPGYHYIAANDGHIFTSPVGHYRPNAFGLYDLHGNVSEWCSDWYGGDYYGKSPANDPAGPATGVERVRRSGSWFSTPGGNRSAYRYPSVPSYRTNNLGFRVARSDGP